jgi:hypothetical protein
MGYAGRCLVIDWAVAHRLPGFRDGVSGCPFRYAGQGGSKYDHIPDWRRVKEETRGNEAF